MIDKIPIYLIITGYFPTPDSWRCAFIYDQVKAIERTGRYRVVVVNCNYGRDYEYDGIRVLSFQNVHRGFALAPWFYDWLNLRRLKAVLPRASINLNEVSVVHAQMVTTGYAAVGLKRLNKRIRALVQFHDLDPMGGHFGDGGKVFGWLKHIVTYRHYRSIVESVDACVSISQNVSKNAMQFPIDAVQKEYPILKNAMADLRHCAPAKMKQLILLHNGVDFRYFSADAEARRKDDNFVIGCVGNFLDFKDQMTLLKAVLALSDSEIFDRLHVRFVGSGPMLEQCRRFVDGNKLSGKVSFETEMDHRCLPSFYRALDLFVLPSYFEGLGCVFLEAHACGVPFMTCENQGMDDFVFNEDRKKWLFPQGDYMTLAQRIKDFVACRCHQSLKDEYNIDKLMPKFLDDVDHLK